MGTSDGTVLSTSRILDNGPTNTRFNLALVSEGYRSGDMPRWHEDSLSFVSYLRRTRPFDDPGLLSRLNVFRVDVTSTEAGADKPAPCFSPATTRATYFDSRFCAGGVQRLLVVDDAIARGVLNAQVPSWHQALVVVNDDEYGGSGGLLGVTSRSAGWQATALHEMGHSAFGLADEYDTYYGCGTPDPARDRYTGPEPAAPNITIDANRATNEWRELIAASTQMPTTSNANCAVCDPQPNPVGPETVGAFEGAGYYHCGLYRPQYGCLMRGLGDPLCAVCMRSIRRTLRVYTGLQRRVEMRAGDVNEIFEPYGRLRVTDSTSPFLPVGASGSGFLQSRRLARAPDYAVAAGLIGYEYRIALTDASGGGPGAAIRTLKLDFGPISPLNYDRSGLANVFVPVEGALGTVGPLRTEQTNNQVTFTFDPPVQPGQSSYFIGMASRYGERDTTAMLRDVAGNTYYVPAKAPAYPA